jgi:hypothetical protein
MFTWKRIPEYCSSHIYRCLWIMWLPKEGRIPEGFSSIVRICVVTGLSGVVCIITLSKENLLELSVSLSLSLSLSLSVLFFIYVIFLFNENSFSERNEKEDPTKFYSKSIENEFVFIAHIM